MERSVVVLPHPDGPKSVKNFPAGTSNEMFFAASTGGPCGTLYSVLSDLTLSTCIHPLPLNFFNADAPAYHLRQHHEYEQAEDQHDPESR